MQQHIEANWEEMREVLESDGTWERSFDTGHLVGEGFYNSGMYASGPRRAVYAQTSRVRIVIKVDQGGKPYVDTASPEIYPNPHK